MSRVSLPIPAVFLNSQGELINQYDKIHLFDVDVQDQQKQYLESQYTQAGNRVVMQHHDCANIGLTVCYDLRFPELFRQLACLGARYYYRAGCVYSSHR